MEMTSKEKIVLIIKESIRLGKEDNFVYDVMFEKHKDVWNINKLTLIMNDKIALFNNLDENSELFKNIYSTAKQALEKLQNNEGYNFYSAELILKINMLEDCFKKKLKPIGSRIVDQIEKPKMLPRTEFENLVEEENLTQEDFSDEDERMKNAELPSGKFLRENVTGEKLHNTIMKKHEIRTSLQQSQL